MFNFEGRGTKKYKFRLVFSKLLTIAGNQAKYKLNKSNTMKGMRMKFTFTFSAIGTCDLLFVTMTCLHNCNLYEQKNLLIQVKRLRAGGGGVNISNSTHGYVLFM